MVQGSPDDIWVLAVQHHWNQSVFLPLSAKEHTG